MPNYPIKQKSFSVSVASGQTVGDSTDLDAKVNGRLRAIYLDAPAMTGATYTVSIIGPASLAGMVLFSKASLTPNAKTNILLDGSNNPLDIPIFGGCQVRITSASSEGSARLINGTLLVDDAS